MATYAIGDLQGCFEPLQRLLRTFDFDAARDRLWFVGDLVNRGPDSLAVLRFVRDLGDRAVVTLGNHDLHLLVAAEGFARLHKGDTLDAILAAPDRDELLAWLRTRPLMHVEGDHAMVHAGLLPSWTIAHAMELASEAQAMLAGSGYRSFFEHMYGNQPDRWDDTLAGWDRLRVVINAFTRMRICSPDGTMEFRHKGELADIPAGFLPWFDVPDRRNRTHTVVFGHWSAVGYRSGNGYLALDSGCLWGRELTAVRLEDRSVFQVPCRAGED
jgi:bis(5'-nucleosyl)-tetraphosphatase (symmetrical)